MSNSNTTQGDPNSAKHDKGADEKGQRSGTQQTGGQHGAGGQGNTGGQGSQQGGQGGRSGQSGQQQSGQQPNRSGSSGSGQDDKHRDKGQDDMNRGGRR